MPASGFVADLVKAFNTLPRLPVLHTARLFGVEHSTVTGWAGALAGVRRRFAVRQSFSSGLDSDTGLPEGCGLSCLGMLILDELLRRWLKCLSPDIHGLTFVDNWEVYVKSEQWLLPAYQRLEQFVQMLDLQLDSKKTYFWSTSGVIRHRLRSAGRTVCLHARDLGAHVVYSKQLGNSTLTSRINGLDSFWDKLAGASGSFAQKVRVVLTAAWPRAFHASAAVIVGRRHLDGLRTRCMQALHLAKPGASPWLQFGLEADGFDPQLWVILDTFRSFRDGGFESSLTPAMDAVVHADHSYVPGSLHEVLYQRIHQLGWTVVTGTEVCDHVGVFALGQIDWVQLVRRIHWAWTRVIARKVSHRASFQCFCRVDRAATRVGLRDWDDYSQGILRRVHNGSCTSNSVSWKWTGDGKETCVVCGAVDTPRHRLWECIGSAELRQELEPWVAAAAPLAPEVLSTHGWTLTSSLADEWWRYLASLDSAIPPPVVAVPSDCIVDLFTDGSCWWQDQIDFRLAAYAVVLAPSLSFGPQGGDFKLLSSGPIPGIVQTSYRAELFGLLVALHYARQQRWMVRVWMDCQSVATKFVLLARGLKTLGPSQPHYDLWQQVMSLAEDIGLTNIQVVKVLAHEVEWDMTTAFDSWVVQGNTAADLAAKQANGDRPAGFWKFWERHSREVVLNKQLGQAVRAHIVKVFNCWNQYHADVVPPPAKESSYGLGTRLPILAWHADSPLELSGKTLVKRFGGVFVHDVLGWLNTLWAPTSELQWISYAQLFVLYQLQFRDGGVCKHDGTWRTFRSQPGSTPEQFRFTLVLKWFRLTIQQLLKDTQTKFVSCTTRPNSSMLCLHLGCIGFPLIAEQHARAEQWLMQHSDRPVRPGSTFTLPVFG